MSKGISRRELLKRFGLTAGALPLLPSLGAWAQTAQAPRKRFVAITITHGIFAQHLLPFIPNNLSASTSSPGNLLTKPSDFMQKVAFTSRGDASVIDLGPYTQALSPIFSSKWQSIKAKTAFVRSLGVQNSVIQGHTSTAWLGGYNAANSALLGESVDVAIARKLNGQLPLVLKTPDYLDDMKSLEDDFMSPTIANTAGTLAAVPALRDPARTWDKLFGNLSTTPPPPTARDPKDRRRALLQRTVSAITRLQNDQRLSQFDANKLAAHSQMLTDQVTALGTITQPQPSTTVTPPARPTIANVTDSAVFAANHGTLFKAQLKNASTALKMNLAQAITINAYQENEWLSDGLSLSGSQAYHLNAGHLANPSTAIIDMCRQVQLFLMDGIADFLADLDQVEDPATGETYLDNTLVYITFEHDGEPNGHLRFAVPVIMAGGFGTFQGGKLYDYSRAAMGTTSDSQGRHHGLAYSRALYTLLDAFGLDASDRSTLGIEGVDAASGWFPTDMTDWNKGLTGLV